jgi:glutamine amidotransferase
MCELLAMSANVPTDIIFSFTGLIRRGGETGPHKDGFGICFYEHGGVREFKDYMPSAESKIAQFLTDFPIKSKLVICHIRQANVGQVSLQNTHPFQREMWGRAWTYAHNGQMPIDQIETPARYQPIGQTDSEKLFCWLMSKLKQSVNENSSFDTIAEHLLPLCNQVNHKGVSNILLSDGEYLYVFCSTKLHWITRKSPFGKAHLCDDDVTLDFSSVTTENDVVTVIATAPLTDNEDWNQMKPGELRVFKEGQSVWTGYGDSVEHKKPVEI